MIERMSCLDSWRTPALRELSAGKRKQRRPTHAYTRRRSVRQPNWSCIRRVPISDLGPDRRTRIRLALKFERIPGRFEEMLLEHSEDRLRIAPGHNPFDRDAIVVEQHRFRIVSVDRNAE